MSYNDVQSGIIINFAPKMFVLEIAILACALKCRRGQKMCWIIVLENYYPSPCTMMDGVVQRCAGALEYKFSILAWAQ